MGGINDATSAEWDLAAKANIKQTAYQSTHALSSKEELLNAASEEAVDHPLHYANGEIETIDYIVDVLGKYDAISYCQGNIIKYTGSRMWAKGNPIQDAKKARWYLNKMIWLLNETKGVNW